MATKIKIITAKDFLEVTPDGIINLATSRQLIVDIAKAEHLPVDYELLVDFRDTQNRLSITDVYQLAGGACQAWRYLSQESGSSRSPGAQL